LLAVVILSLSNATVGLFLAGFLPFSTRRSGFYPSGTCNPLVRV
jgi:hypothetical protein